MELRGYFHPRCGGRQEGGVTVVRHALPIALSEELELSGV